MDSRGLWVAYLTPHLPPGLEVPLLGSSSPILAFPISGPLNLCHLASFQPPRSMHTLVTQEKCVFLGAYHCFCNGPKELVITSLPKMSGLDDHLPYFAPLPALASGR